MSGFQPALLTALGAVASRPLRHPLATNMDQARSLARDRGQTLRERQEQDPGPNAWPLALQRYAGLQQSLAA